MLPVTEENMQLPLGMGTLTYCLDSLSVRIVGQCAETKLQEEN